MVNRYKKDVLVDTHKVATAVPSHTLILDQFQIQILLITDLLFFAQVHLMCLIANGMYRNRLCSEPDLLAITLSLMPAQCSTVTKERIDQTYLSRLLQWCVLASLFSIVKTCRAKCRGHNNLS